MYVAVEDGKAAGLEYMPEHPVSEGALCPRGNAVLETLNHPERLRHPLKKVDDEWQRISWPEALDLVSQKIGEVRRVHGPDALGFLASAKCTIVAEGLTDRAFVSQRTNGYDELVQIVQHYTLDRVPDTTGVRPDLIVEAARAYGKAPSAVIVYCIGITQRTTGGDNTFRGQTRGGQSPRVPDRRDGSSVGPAAPSPLPVDRREKSRRRVAHVALAWG